MSEEIQRAVMLMNKAAHYIRSHSPDFLIFYDEAQCDGYCLADDLETSASILEEK